MSEVWENVNTVCCKPWLVLPTVYSDALSYGEQLDKFCYSLNKVIENNNILPDYVAEKIREYISSGAIGEVVRDILANYILNVKYPPEGITPAVGDGSADDTSALQGCIDYAAENGGVVYFPYGSYLTQPLTMKSGVSLFGFDRYSTKIVLKGGATKALLNGNGNNLSVCSLTLDGNSGIQVNDVNVVDMTGSDLLFNNLIIKDGYKLFNFIGDGHLQLDNIVFGSAVENCFSVDGNVIVEAKNLLFTALSKVGGISVVNIKSNGGDYDFNSVAKCDTCMLISGNDNKIIAMIGGANNDYDDSGEHNNVEIVGHSKKEYFSGNVKKDANNSETTLQGTRSLHVVGANTFAVDGNSTESVDGNKSEIVTGTTSETYKDTKTINLTNEDKTLTGKKTTTANSIAETVTGEKTVNANSIAETSSNRKIKAEHNYEIDINGVYTGKFGVASFETDATNWLVKFPDKTVDLADINKKPERNFWLISDSYGSTYNPDTETYTDGWCNLLAKNLLPSFPFANNIYVDYQGGAGFSGGSSTFTALITEWIQKYNDITDVVICAGRNDFFQNTNDIGNGMKDVANLLKSKFPNIRMYVGMIGYDLNITEITNNKFYAGIETTINYKNNASAYGYTYLTGVEAILHNSDLLRSDGKHPNDKGAAKLAEGIFQALQGECSVGYPLRTCSITVNNGSIQTGDFREILNNTTISILNSSGINLTFSPNRSILCNPESYVELIGTVDFKYFNGYEYGLSRIPCIFVYSNAGVYETASGYISFEGHKLYVAILKLNDAKNNFDTISIDTLQILPFSTQYSF